VPRISCPEKSTVDKSSDLRKPKKDRKYTKIEILGKTNRVEGKAQSHCSQSTRQEKNERDGKKETLHRRGRRCENQFVREVGKGEIFSTEGESK